MVGLDKVCSISEVFRRPLPSKHVLNHNEILLRDLHDLRIGHLTSAGPFKPSLLLCPSHDRSQYELPDLCSASLSFANPQPRKPIPPAFATLLASSAPGTSAMGAEMMGTHRSVRASDLHQGVLGGIMLETLFSRSLGRDAVADGGPVS